MAASKFIFKFTPYGFAVWVLMAFSLTACGGGAETPPPEAVFTSAAQTAQARSTEMFALTPTIDPASMVATIAAPSPTATEVVPASQPAANGQSTAAPLGGTAPAAGVTPITGTTPAAPPVSAGPDVALYVADVNIPDGTVFSPGEAFEKVWRIQNSGTTTWTETYTLVFVDGDLMGAESKILLDQEVAPGEQVEVSVPMVAPETAGTYTGYWKMTTADSTLFGFGATGAEAIWVKITVSGAGADTPEASAASGPAAVVAQASLSVDNSAASGPCPYTFNFAGQITLTKAATVTYLLEAGSVIGDNVRTPLPMTRNLPQGVHPVIYELTLPDSFSGWARLHITAPIDLVSDPVNIDLACG
jgi:hypothetical protein